MCHWRPYLWGRRFVVRTNHFSLIFLLDQRLATIAWHHWVGKLLGFDFTIEYEAGSTNTDEATFLNVSGPRFDFVDRLRQAHSNPALVALAEEIKTKQHPAPWSLIDNLIAFKRRLYIPLASTLLPEVITAIHDDCHKGIQRTLHHLRRDFILRSIAEEYIRGLRS